MASKRDPSKAKKKLRTSKDVFDRLKWDAESTGIDTSSVFIGYKDRFLGMCELPFTSYNPGGDIPYHRIYYFRTGGPPICPRIGELGEVQVREDNWPEDTVILWDRDQRIDLIFKSGETMKRPGVMRPHQTRVMRTPSEHEHDSGLITVPLEYESVPVWKFNQIEGEWELSKSDSECYERSNISVLTYNVLYELYEPELVQCPTRWPRLIKYLESLSDTADFILLQEVTKPFLALLQTQNWVREKYYLSDIEQESKTIQPYGQLVLSKLKPSSIFFCDHSVLKKRIVIPVFSINGMLLVIPVIHFKSNWKRSSNATSKAVLSVHENGEEMRRLQIQHVINACQEIRTENIDVLIVGDTNCFSEHEIGLRTLSDAGFIDIWPHLKGEDDNGFTFDTRNPLLSPLRRRHRDGRIDRLFMKSKDATLWPTGIRLLGNEDEYEEHPLSDHFGIFCSFELVEKAEIPEDRFRLVYTSSVIASPFEGTELWDFVQGPRSKYDPSYARWMPHVNLLYAFVEDDAKGLNFLEAEERFTLTLTDMEPFTVIFSSIKFFHHQHSTIVYLAPDEESRAKLVSLQRLLYNEYPMCTEQSSKSSEGFVPHLTLAKINSKDMGRKEMEDEIEGWKHGLEQLLERGQASYDMDRIYVISRRGDEPFKIRKTVYLADSNPGSIDLDPTANIDMQAFLLSYGLVPTVDKDMTDQILSEVARLYRIVLEETGIELNEGTLASDFKMYLHLCGSRALGFHHDKSDVDLLITGPMKLSTKVFFENLSEVISSKKYTHSEFRFHYIAQDTLVPIARFSIYGIDVDLVYANIGSYGPQYIQNMEDRTVDNLTDINFRCISAVRDCNTLLSKVEEANITLDEFRNGVKFIRFWAKRRGIYSNGFGYLNSLSWSIMVAFAAIEVSKRIRRPITSTDIIRSFFTTFATWKWSKHVSISGLPSPQSLRRQRPIPVLMPIHAPSYPYENKATHVTKSTMGIIQTEIRRGYKLVAESGLNKHVMEDLVQELGRTDCSHYLKIQFEAKELKQLQLCTGFLQSQLVGMIVQLERESNVRIRPFPYLSVVVHEQDGSTRTISIDGDHLDFHSLSICNNPVDYVMTTFIGLSSTTEDQIKHTKAVKHNFIHQFEIWPHKPAQANLEVEIVDSNEFL